MNLFTTVPATGGEDTCFHNGMTESRALPRFPRRLQLLLTWRDCPFHVPFSPSHDPGPHWGGGDPDPTGCGTIFLWRNGNCHIWGMQEGKEILAVDSSPFPGATAAHAKNPPPLNRQQQAFAPSTNPTWQTLRRYQHTRRTGARHQSVALVFPPPPSSSRLLPVT